MLIPLWVSDKSLRDDAFGGAPGGCRRGRFRRAIDTPFAAVFVATFYSDVTIRTRAEIIRALLHAMANADILAFASSAYSRIHEERARVQVFANVVSLVRHSIDTRISVIEMAIADLRLARSRSERKEALSDIVSTISFIKDATHYAPLQMALMQNPVDALGRGTHDVNALVRQEVDTWSDCRIVFQPAREPAFAITHPVLLRSMIAQLISNARDFIDRHSGRIWVGLAVTPSDVEIHVEDNGSGIDANIMPKLFQPFASSRPASQDSPHWGLGLTSVRYLAAAHRGTVEPSRSSCGGARFVVKLPRTKGETL